MLQDGSTVLSHLTDRNLQIHRMCPFGQNPKGAKAQAGVRYTTGRVVVPVMEEEFGYQ